MKIKIGFSILISLFFQLSIFAQTIIGPDYLCVGECGTYMVVDDNDVQIDEDFEWDFGDGFILTGSNVDWCPGWANSGVITASLDGNVVAEFQFWGTDCCSFIAIDGPNQICVGECGFYISQTGGAVTWYTNNGQDMPNGMFCPSYEGIYEIIAVDWNGCSESFSVVVNDLGPVEIFNQAAALCLDDSLSNCEQICENTTVTYTTEVNLPGLPVSWSVSGAENWEANGNEVTVEWGDPGQGQVSVAIGNTQTLWYFSCGNFQSATPGQSDGSAYINFSTIGSYTVEINNPSQVFNVSGVSGFVIHDLAAGDYDVIVTDEFGISQNCFLEILEGSTTCYYSLGVKIDVDYGSGQDCCGTTLNATVQNGFYAPYTYLWSTVPAQTTQNLTDVCMGDYSVTITDANGCSSIGGISYYYCGSQNGCSGTNSICVDILELPEAQFQTNPPAVNNVIEICEGQTVFFDNLTYGGFNYTWDFGTGISSSLVDAEHTYLSAGTYEAVLIARNNCFCSDSSSVTIIVEEAITPEIDCAGTLCPGEEITYTSNADCSIFNWSISSNGTIVSGGNTNDNFITIDWGAGPEGVIELSVGACNGDYCVQTLFETIPIIDDNAEIRGPIRVCKGAEVIYSMPAFAGTEFNWEVTSFGTITDGQGTNEITVQWANEITSQTQQVSVDYESCYLGCGGSDVLDVNILNEVYIIGPILACPDQMETYYCRTPSGNLVQADWTVLNAFGTEVASSTGVTPDFDVNWNFGSGNYTVHAEVTNPTAYCIDNFSVFVEVVTPTALPSGIDGILEICPGTSYSYTGTSAAGSFDYTWYVSNGSSNTVLNGKTVNVIWGPNPPYLLELTQTNLEGFACESESISASPYQIGSVTLNGTQIICNEEIGTYTATDFPNLEYEWLIIPTDAGSVIEGANSHTAEIQWHIPGDWDVEVSVCGVNATIPVTVNPLPSPTPIFDPVCPGQTGLFHYHLLIIR